jgi:hypothetical protein
MIPLTLKDRSIKHKHASIHVVCFGTDFYSTISLSHNILSSINVSLRFTFTRSQHIRAKLRTNFRLEFLEFLDLEPHKPEN